MLTRGKAGEPLEAGHFDELFYYISVLLVVSEIPWSGRPSPMRDAATYGREGTAAMNTFIFGN